MKTAIGVLVGLFLSLVIVHFAVAQEKKEFPLGVPVETQALFCFSETDARAIADNKGEVPANLIMERKCVQMRGVGIYTKETYNKNGWRVYELRSGNVTLWEATDYIGRVKGQVDT